MNHPLAQPRRLTICCGCPVNGSAAGRLIHQAGAAPDHPGHPALPESAYLKFLVHALM